MGVTKQQQLKWLVKNHNFTNQHIKYVVMSASEIGLIIGSGTSCSTGLSISCHTITREEWQQERDKMQKQQPTIGDEVYSVLQENMKNDNSWHERGELPPAGCECEVKTKTFSGWMKCFVVGKSSRGDTVIECDDCAFIIDSSYEFRPLRTEREKAIDEMIMAIDHIKEGNFQTFIGALYDVGYRKQ